MLRDVAAAILAAWIVSLARMTAIALAIAPALISTLLPPMVAAASALLVPAVICFASTRHSADGALPLRNPFELSEVLKFGALLTAIMLCGKAAAAWFGPAGLSALGALSGILDVDPITLSMARNVQGGSDAAFGASVILLAALTNAGAKAVMGSAFGGLRLGLLLTASMAAAVTAGGLLVLL
jgi:uncharacterized membrane protein (DUF4010 family)